MIAGVVTTRDVLLHPFLIGHAFGWAVLAHAVAAMLSGRRTTFLSLVAEVSR